MSGFFRDSVDASHTRSGARLDKKFLKSAKKILIHKKCSIPWVFLSHLGLDPELFPLSKPFSPDYNPSEIDSWEKYYKARGLSMNNLASLVLEVPLTVGYLIKKYVPVQEDCIVI